MINRVPRGASRENVLEIVRGWVDVLAAQDHQTAGLREFTVAINRRQPIAFGEGDQLRNIRGKEGFGHDTQRAGALLFHLDKAAIDARNRVGIHLDGLDAYPRGSLLGPDSDALP